jgi:small subunit ribosomal protein S5
MGKKFPGGLRISPQGYRPNYGKRLKPEEIGLQKNPDIINRVATGTPGKGIRNTQFRLPYLSNLRKMDPVFDDPYEVAAQTIRNTRKPGDPQIILDPDGLYEEDDKEGNSMATNVAEQSLLRKGLVPPDSYDKFNETQRFQDLMDKTGMKMEDIERLRKRTLIRNFVSNQIRTGKIHSIYMLSVVGNGNGMVGFGEGKSVDFAVAENMALIQAIKNMMPVDRFENRTVYGDLEGRFGASTVTLRARPPGFGVRANYYVHEVCQCAGITDVSGKVRGSMNGMNVVKAVFEGLRHQRLPSTIAKQRGMHVIDVRERYFHGR